ncbi:MAG: ATP-binding protein [Acidobacteria bacterium]|nr:ATP-binding protein [Acidobacteriota bacterium]
MRSHLVELLPCLIRLRYLALHAGALGKLFRVVGQVFRKQFFRVFEFSLLGSYDSNKGSGGLRMIRCGILRLDELNEVCSGAFQILRDPMEQAEVIVVLGC